jgi:prefoldin alpha subunit
MSKKPSQKELEEKFRALVTELRFLEGMANEIQSRIAMASAAIRDFNLSSTTIQGLEDLKKGSEILVPIGGGSYIKARVDDTDNVITNVGSGVSLEKARKDAAAFVEKNIAEIQKGGDQLQNQLVQVMRRIEVLRVEIQKITTPEQM